MSKKYNLEKLRLDPAPIEDLFGEYRNKARLEEELVENNKERIHHIEIKKILSYSKHHFVISKDEEWTTFVESVRQFGVLQPIIVRKHPSKEGYYETLAGHRRTEAAKECDLEKIPALLVEADDIDASVLVGLTNKQREHTSDIEWGWTYRETYELIKRQGERTDLTCAHRGHKLEGGNYAHDGHNLKGIQSIEILAQKYGEGRNTIKRKIRLTYLIPELKEQYEKKKIKQSIAVNLSYLTEKEQHNVIAVTAIEKVHITESIAEKLKADSKEANSQERELTVDDVRRVILQEAPGKPEATKQDIKIRCLVPEAYLPEGLKKKEQEDYILKALRYVWENKIIVS